MDALTDEDTRVLSVLYVDGEHTLETIREHDAAPDGDEMEMDELRLVDLQGMGLLQVRRVLTGGAGYERRWNLTEPVRRAMEVAEALGRASEAELREPPPGAG